MPGNIALTDAAALYKQNEDGSYTFTFPTAAPALPTLADGFPIAPVQSAQTLVGIHAARTFEGVQYPAGASLEFIPAGGTVTPRQVVSDAACNKCHKHLTAHGTRRTVGLCLTCHTPGWVQNPTANNTANAIDFRRLVHQIHRGQQPTDVQNTNPWVYKWSATNDFSTVAFAPPNTVRNCVFCHEGGAQSDNWKTKPSRVACGSCHYAVDFATGAGHLGGPQPDDSACANCHQPDTDGAAPSITKVHSFLYDALTNTTFNGADLGVVIDSVDVTNPTAGTVTFTVTRDGAPADIKATPLDSLRFTIAGPTTDYGGAKGPVAGCWRPQSRTRLHPDRRLQRRERLVPDRDGHARPVHRSARHASRGRLRWPRRSTSPTPAARPSAWASRPTSSRRHLSDAALRRRESGRSGPCLRLRPRPRGSSTPASAAAPRSRGASSRTPRSATSATRISASTAVRRARGPTTARCATTPRT